MVKMSVSRMLFCIWGQELIATLEKDNLKGTDYLGDAACLCEDNMKSDIEE
jgi:hypothetical protein